MTAPIQATPIRCFNSPPRDSHTAWERACGPGTTLHAFFGTKCIHNSVTVSDGHGWGITGDAIVTLIPCRSSVPMSPAESDSIAAVADDRLGDFGLFRV